MASSAQPSASAAALASAAPRGRRAFWRQFARSRAGVVGLFLIGLLVAAALLAPWLAREAPDEQDLGRATLPPSIAHPFGTDDLGRDLFSRVLYGARISLGLAVLIVAVAGVTGCAAGLAAAHYGRWVDEVVMRATDVLLAFPGFLLAIAVVSVLGGGNLANVAAALAIYIVPGFARLARASALAQRGQEYIDAARAIGARDAAIMWRHILPNTLGSLLVQASLRMGTVILLLSGFSFLGLGPKPPTPEWGLMLASGDDFLRTAPHLSLIPGAAILLAVLGFNLVGDALRDALDPRLR